MKIAATQLDAVLTFLFENKMWQYADDVAKATNVSEDTLSSILAILRKDGYIFTEPIGSDTLPMAKLSDEGVAFCNCGGYAKEQEKASFAKRKAEIDFANAERVYKTYRSTRFIAWTTFSIAVILALLRLAEALKLLPFHR